MTQFAIPNPPPSLASEPDPLAGCDPIRRQAIIDCAISVWQHAIQPVENILSRLAGYAAASQLRNTPEFLDGLFALVEEAQAFVAAKPDGMKRDRPTLDDLEIEDSRLDAHADSEATNLLERIDAVIPATFDPKRGPLTRLSMLVGQWERTGDWIDWARRELDVLGVNTAPLTVDGLRLAIMGQIRRPGWLTPTEAAKLREERDSARGAARLIMVRRHNSDFAESCWVKEWPWLAQSELTSQNPPSS